MKSSLTVETVIPTDTASALLGKSSMTQKIARILSVLLSRLVGGEVAVRIPPDLRHCFYVGAQAADRETILRQLKAARTLSGTARREAGGTLANLFHHKAIDEKPRTPTDHTLWPEAWTTVVFKEYPQCPRIMLPKEHAPLKALDRLLHDRHSTRAFDTANQLSQEELGTLLFYTAGVRPSTDGGTQPWEQTRRFYPSGGARYPLETYLLIRRVDGITPGTYHYNIKHHALERLSKEENDSITNRAHAYEWAHDAAVTFITSAIWDRNFMKYGSFGYRIVLAEAGHQSQNLHLVAESLGLAYCPLAGFRIHTGGMNELLGLNTVQETALYVTVIGKKLPHKQEA